MDCSIVPSNVDLGVSCYLPLLYILGKILSRLLKMTFTTGTVKFASADTRETHTAEGEIILYIAFRASLGPRRSDQQ